MKLNRTVVVSQVPYPDFTDRYQVPLLSIESNRLIGADIARWVDGLLDAQFQP